MATNFHDAMTAVYALISPPLPSLWFAVAPEGTARALPNVVMTHGGETPEYDSADADGIIMEKARATFTAYGSNEDVRAIAESIKGAYPANVLLTAIGAKKTRLYRKTYIVRPSTQRGPQGEFLFEAEVPFEAEIT